MKAYLQFGQWGGPYQTVEVPCKETESCPRNPYVMGYGRKIPTQYMIQYTGRWRRVYACQYGNAATLWAYVAGKEVVCDVWR
jgi:hypothetical protein